MDWRRAPEQYGAIHFHDDDLHDAGWTPSLTLTIPADARSGVYALRLEAAGGPEFWVVFYVRPPRRGPRARVAFLASTATYLAYSNYRARMRPGPAELYIGALPIVDPTDLLLMYHPELGRLDLRHALRRLGRLPRLAAAAHRQHAADGPPLELLPRPVPPRLARGRGAALRRHHRRRSPRRGRGAARGLRGGPDRLPPRVLLPRDAGRAGGPSRPRRAAHVHGRQRLLLARLVSRPRIPG